MSTIAISEAEFQSLRDLIRERFGIFYDDTKQFLLQSRLQTRLLKCRVTDFGGYHRFLTSSPDRETEWAELASVLSNNETYFFREKAQLEVLVTDVLDEALKNGSRLRVWSSASSTGEEPFTIAMMLMETHKMTPAHVTLRATDISPRALEKASTAFLSASCRSGRRRPRWCNGTFGPSNKDSLSTTRSSAWWSSRA